jgi:hypothetical protein
VSSVQPCCRAQRIAGAPLSSYKSVHDSQGLLGNIYCCRKHEDGRLRPKSSHFDCKLQPVHPRREIVHDYDVNQMDRSQFESFAAARCGQDGVPRSFKQSPFALQHILVIVDAKDYRVLQRFIDRGWHSASLKNPSSTLWARNTVHNRPNYSLSCDTGQSCRTTNDVEQRIMNFQSRAIVGTA